LLAVNRKTKTGRFFLLAVNRKSVFIRVYLWLSSPSRLEFWEQPIGDLAEFFGVEEAEVADVDFGDETGVDQAA
jgi:hypothetical protein